MCVTGYARLVCSVQSKERKKVVMGCCTEFLQKIEAAHATAVDELRDQCRQEESARKQVEETLAELRDLSKQKDEQSQQLQEKLQQEEEARKQAEETLAEFGITNDDDLMVAATPEDEPELQRKVQVAEKQLQSLQEKTRQQEEKAELLRMELTECEHRRKMQEEAKARSFPTWDWMAHNSRPLFGDQWRLYTDVFEELYKYGVLGDRDKKTFLSIGQQKGQGVSELGKAWDTCWRKSWDGTRMGNHFDNNDYMDVYFRHLCDCKQRVLAFCDELTIDLLLEKKEQATSEYTLRLSQLLHATATQVDKLLLTMMLLGSEAAREYENLIKAVLRPLGQSALEFMCLVDHREKGAIKMGAAKPTEWIKRRLLDDDRFIDGYMPAYYKDVVRTCWRLWADLSRNAIRAPEVKVNVDPKDGKLHVAFDDAYEDCAFYQYRDGEGLGDNINFVPSIVPKVRRLTPIERPDLNKDVVPDIDFESEFLGKYEQVNGSDVLKRYPVNVPGNKDSGKYSDNTLELQEFVDDGTRKGITCAMKTAVLTVGTNYENSQIGRIVTMGDMRTLCAAWFQIAMLYPWMAQGICLAVAHLNSKLPNWAHVDTVRIFVCLAQNCYVALAEKIVELEKQIGYKEWRINPDIPDDKKDELMAYEMRMVRNLVLINWMVYYNFLSLKVYSRIIANFIGKPGDEKLPPPFRVHLICKVLMTNGKSLLEFPMMERSTEKIQQEHVETIRGFYLRIKELIDRPEAQQANGYDDDLKRDMQFIILIAETWLEDYGLEGENAETKKLEWPKKKDSPLQRVTVRLRYNPDSDETDLLSCLCEDHVFGSLPGDWTRAPYEQTKYAMAERVRALKTGPDHLHCVHDSQFSG